MTSRNIYVTHAKCLHSPNISYTLLPVHFQMLPHSYHRHDLDINQFKSLYVKETKNKKKAKSKLKLLRQFHRLLNCDIRTISFP